MTPTIKLIEYEDGYKAKVLVPVPKWETVYTTNGYLPKSEAKKEAQEWLDKNRKGLMK